MSRRVICSLLATLFTALTFAATAAATTLDFEDLGANLPLAHPDTSDPLFFYNGFTASRAGDPTDFASAGAVFNNDFSDFGGGCCWQGWAYSQLTDTTTPGFGNQHSAIAGGGASGSATYGVAFTGGQVGAQASVSRIVFDAEVSVLGASFTNTTYASLSMRDGDAFAKKFGGATGSDPDFFTLTVTGRDASNAATGSVELALADFRFADDALDFIVMDWIFVDLSSLGAVAALEFELASSDEAFGFLNTPSYFAMDDLVLVPEPGTVLLLGFGLALLARRRS
jgi:Domain of unknown function (DUF4465)/PEP-CTERM motif